MRRIWLIFWHTYWDNITRRSYLFFTFGLPFFIIAIPIVTILLFFIAFILARPSIDARPIGIINQPEAFAAPEAFSDRPVPMQAFSSLTAAETALAAGEIQAYYYFAPDYWTSGQVTLSYEEPPAENVLGLFERWVTEQVHHQVPPALLTRYRVGPDIIQQRTEGEDGRSAADNVFEWLAVFMLVYLTRSAGMFTSGYMYDSIASEARNRTLEILLTTVSRLQFVTGKLVGLLGVGLTQLGVWGGGLFLLMVVGAAAFEVNLLVEILAWEHLRIAVSLLLGAYVLDQIMAASAGMLRVSGGAGPQLFNMFSWVNGLALIYVLVLVPLQPDTPLAVAGSLFPLTAPIVLLVRLTAAEVPQWQLYASELILWLTCVLGVFGLRSLLKVNMVAYTDRFSILTWLRAKIRRRDV